MAGQFIRLPGVTVPAGAAAPRIDMSEADMIAARIPSLRYAIASREMGTGGVGNSRVAGEATLPQGTVSALSVGEVSGQAGIRVSPANSAAGIALPQGSASAAYTAVMALALDAVDVAGSGIVNALTAMQGDTLVQSLVRYYGVTATTAQDKLAFHAGTAALLLDRPAGAWCIVAVGADPQTGLIHYSVNGGTSQQTARAYAPEADSYIEIGYHSTPSGLRASSVGDLFVFGECLQSMPGGMQRLAALIAAMKTQYGVS